MLTPPRSLQQSSFYRRYLELTMPLGALDALMLPVLHMLAQRSSGSPEPLKCAGVLFAGDHAVAREHGVSAYPAEVTPQMVANIVGGGAAISCLARLRDAPLWICDVGVAHGFDEILELKSSEYISFKRENIHKKFPSEGYERGSRDITTMPALSLEAHEHCWNVGASLVEEIIAKTECDVVFLGEMGIGNTTPASALASLVLQRSAQECVGRGTGISDAVLNLKIGVVERANQRARNQSGWKGIQSLDDAHHALREVGGAELSALAGAAWRAAQLGRFVLLDGLIVTAALAPFAAAEKSFSPWLLASHESAEPVHAHLLREMGLKPLLSLGLRLGEGSGAALAAGLLKDADYLLRNMATFSSAGVSSGTKSNEVENGLEPQGF